MLTKKEEQLIDRRTKLALKLLDACFAVDQLIEQKGASNLVEDYDWLTGCEIYANPVESGERIKEVLKKHEK